jgi:hypothetical protein
LVFLHVANSASNLDIFTSLSIAPNVSDSCKKKAFTMINNFLTDQSTIDLLLYS